MIFYKKTLISAGYTMQQETFSRLPYNPETLPRELKKFYISASENDIKEMFDALDGIETREDLFSHIPQEYFFTSPPAITERLEYADLIKHVEELALKNNPKTCFIGESFKWYSQSDIVDYVCSLRGLTTAYTPYQPERSQGTLHTLWIYSSLLSQMTGFEAINASFYERPTALFEACNTALRLSKGKTTILLSEGIYPTDLEVIETLAKNTTLNIKYFPIDRKTGTSDIDALKQMISENADTLSGIAFPQTNKFGLLEDVDQLTDLSSQNNLQSIGIFDPMLLATGGLKQPSLWGSDSQGVKMIVGEGQHLAIGPNYGGPGLGIFGIRYNEQDKISIRSSAGRFVGKGQDENGKPCLAMVLSTREQHIRREKATSNICSNQSFLATIAGASLLYRGEEGLKEVVEKSRENLTYFWEKISGFAEIKLAFEGTSFFNEICLELPGDISTLSKKASKRGFHLSSLASNYLNEDRNITTFFFNDQQTKEEIDQLVAFLKEEFSLTESSTRPLPELESNLLRSGTCGLSNFSSQEVRDYYQKLDKQNLSPDDNIYPLGSCTMKYNPYINDYAAGLSGFTSLHPLAPEEDSQGSLEVLYEIQEIFKRVTGLPGVTTQPVAGAQGELVGLKLFQAYHESKGNLEKKDIIIIPKSAHGTNPATATMAGFHTKKTKEGMTGIVSVNANSKGQIDFDELKSLVELYGERISGIMITNPNTSGVLELKFKEIADLIHSVDGLVYMDGANMNAIAGWIDLDKIGVDAVHNNLHKTWTVPHGGGGPGDAIVAVSEKLIDFLPGSQIALKDGVYSLYQTPKTIGSFHRHHGNFAHKVRSYTYLKALGSEGVREMSAIAVLSANYLYQELKDLFPTLPEGAHDEPRMHEFIITITKDQFDKIQNGGVPKSQAIAKIGKLFLDFGLHAPTVSFPEQFGLMIEPTESFSKDELDRFIEVLRGIHFIINEHPHVLKTTPHFTPVRKVDEVGANKVLTLKEEINQLPKIHSEELTPNSLKDFDIKEIVEKIVEAAKIH